MSKIFFTSDTHFGHESIIKLSNRPFKNVEEMNRTMVERWNEKIGPEDTVYHLGDFALTKNHQWVGEVIDSLNGKIHLIAGNHEHAALANADKFEWVKDYFELRVDDPEHPKGAQWITLFHYAMRVWRHDFRGTWQLYGHTHGTLPDKPHKRAIDVGVDCHNFYPLSYEEVKTIMKTKNWVNPFGDRNG